MLTLIYSYAVDNPMNNIEFIDDANDNPYYKEYISS